VLLPTAELARNVTGASTPAAVPSASAPSATAAFAQPAYATPHDAIVRFDTCVASAACN